MGGEATDPKTVLDHNKITKDLDLLEKLRRAERNERTKEDGDNELDHVMFDDKDDPLCLDGPIMLG